MHPPDWLIPDWPAPAGVRALCTTRAGGVSLAPYDALNLGDHVGDHPQHVAANRALLQQALGAQPVFLSQVHGTHTVWLTDTVADGTSADACITDQAGLACTIMVADCLPVLFTNAQGTLVAAAHAGWRGLVGQGGHGVLEDVCEHFRMLAPVSSAYDAIKIIAWLGPCIGRERFEVGDEVRTAFVGRDPAAAVLFTPGSTGKWLADLQGLARLRLAALGVNHIYGNDGSRSWCTVSNPSRFFSYRRDGVSGRMAVCIWRD
jgi:YfiH family protein